MAMSARAVRRTGADEFLVVNPIMCVGHGLCAELAPEWIALDDWGYPMIKPDAVPPKLRDHIERAIDACPTLALQLQRRER
jgi:ferredoxin